MLEFENFKDHVITNQLASHYRKGVIITLQLGVNITSGKLTYTIKSQDDPVLVTPDVIEAIERYNQLTK
jgi:hypothetical protein